MASYKYIMTFCIISLLFSLEAHSAELRLGIGSLQQSSVYIQADSITRIMPIIIYESDAVSVRGPLLDWRLWKNKNTQFGIGLGLDSSFLDHNETHELEDWDDISMRYSVHLFTAKDLSKNTSVRVSLAREFSGKTNANSAEIKFEHSINLSLFRLFLNAGSSWNDEHYYQYLFTDNDDSNVFSTLNHFVGVAAVLPITTNIANIIACCCVFDTVETNRPNPRVESKYKNVVAKRKGIEPRGVTPKTKVIASNTIVKATNASIAKGISFPIIS